MQAKGFIKKNTGIILSLSLKRDLPSRSVKGVIRGKIVRGL